MEVAPIVLCSYILMAEPDHLIVRPIPNLSKDGLGAAFPFFYIEPTNYESTLRKFFPPDKGPITSIDPIGNSPVIIEKVFFLMQTIKRKIYIFLALGCHMY